MEFKPKDGKIKGSVTLGPPKLPSVLDVCPNRNWSIDILSLTYGNVALDLERKNSDVLKFNFGNVTQ